MKRVNLKEIQVLVDDFRAEVISAILSAFPGRAVDNENPDDDVFLLDGVPVKVEGDRIVIGDDLDNYIPLKNPPIAGNPPQYREVDSIIADLKAYVGKEKREEGIMILKIKEEVKIPGTSVVLERGDRIYIKKEVREATEIFKESSRKKEMFTGKVAALLRALEAEGWDVDVYEDYVECLMGNLLVVVNDNGNVSVTDRYDRYGAMIKTNVTSFARDYGKIIDKYLKSRYDYGGYKYQAPSNLVLESVSKMKEATVTDIEKLLKKTGWNIEDTDDDYLLAQYGDEVFSINADSGEVSVGTDEGSEVIWTGSYDDFVKTYKGVKDDKILVGGKSLKAVTESVKKMKESMSSRTVSNAKDYWKKLCKKYKTAEEFSSLINQWDGDRFFEFMADALGLDFNEDDKILERMESEFYEKVTNPVEMEVFGKSVSSVF